MLASFLALTLLTAQAVPEQCSVIIRHPSGSGFTHQPVPGYSVANATPPLRLPDGYAEVETLVCARPTLVITDNDFRVVLELGVPMMIGAGGVFGSLEMVDGRFRFDLVKGELNSAQKETVQTALNRGQELARERTQ